MLLNTLLFTKVSKKSFRDIGLFSSRLLRQLAIGVVIGAIFFIVGGIFDKMERFFHGKLVIFHCQSNISCLFRRTAISRLYFDNAQGYNENT